MLRGICTLSICRIPVLDYDIKITIPQKLFEGLLAIRVLMIWVHLMFDEIIFIVILAFF